MKKPKVETFEFSSIIPKVEMFEFFSSIPQQSETPAENTDIISNLPDPILQHIVSLLPIENAIRTSVLSKRFEAIWLKYPILEINESQCIKSVVIIDDNDEDVPTPREMFLRRLRRCVERHDLQLLAKLKIHAKQIANKNIYNDLFVVIDRLLNEVAKGNTIEEMDLKFHTPDEPKIFIDPKPIKFYESFYMVSKPQFLSWQKTLKSLKLKGCSFGAIESMGSDDIKFPFLKELFVSNCLITDVIIPNLISWCPELEDLTMQYMVHVETIQFSHRKLNRLTLGCYRSSTVFQIDVPNLTEFVYKGTPWLCDFDRFECHESVVRFQENHLINAPNLQSLFIKYARVHPETIRITMSSLSSIRKLVFQFCLFPETRRFSAENLERLMFSECNFGIGEGKLYISESRLPNLKYLIIYSCKRLRVLVLHCPQMMMLVLKHCEDCGGLNIIEPHRRFKMYD